MARSSQEDQRKLILKLAQLHELRVAASNLTAGEVISTLDYAAYYRALGFAVPESLEKALGDLANGWFLKATDAGTWDITNLGALMIAHDLNDFPSLSKKVVRVIQYYGNDRLRGRQERTFVKGYVQSYEEIVQFITAIIPRREELIGPKRVDVLSFPEVAIREIVANMLMHQAIEQTGTNLMVEVFANRIEFTNPGSSPIPIERIVDMAPRTRNERMAGFFHKCGFCEERGSGYDKIVDATCKEKLLAPKIATQSNLFTKATLYSHIPLEHMSKEDRIWTCYMFACLKQVSLSPITNSDIRTIFGIPASQRSKATTILNNTLSAGLIKVLDPKAGPRSRSYVPSWA